MRLLDSLLPKAARYQFGGFDFPGFLFNGYTYTFGTNGDGYTTTYGKNPAEPIPTNFADYASAGFASDGVVFAVEQKRLSIFSEARFQFRRFTNGRPGDLFGDQSLSILEHPWPGGTTGDLLARMILDADLAGNAYIARFGDELVRLRPDWVEIVLAPRLAPYGPGASDVQVGFTRAGYFYYEGGPKKAHQPAVFAVDEVAHFAPTPDPLATYRGMSWLTPVVREIQSDRQYVTHQQAFLENAATPNLAVSLPREITPDQFAEFKAKMDADHKGPENAYKTLYTGGGADVTVIGANMQQLDFTNSRGAGETRIAMAGGIHPAVLGSTDGLKGSAMNAGNYTASKRATADATFRPLWRNVSGSLEVIAPPPPGSQLWVDERDIAFLREDVNDQAQIQSAEAQTIRNLLDAGFTADTVKAAVIAQDWGLLTHSGLFSVQLQAPGSGPTPTPQAVP